MVGQDFWREFCCEVLQKKKLNISYAVNESSLQSSLLTEFVKDFLWRDGSQMVNNSILKMKVSFISHFFSCPMWWLYLHSLFVCLFVFFLFLCWVIKTDPKAPSISFWQWRGCWVRRDWPKTGLYQLLQEDNQRFYHM